MKNLSAAHHTALGPEEPVPSKVRIPHTGWELLTKKALIEWWQHATAEQDAKLDMLQVIARQQMNSSAHGVDVTLLFMMARKPWWCGGYEKTPKNQRGLRQKWRWQQTRQSQLREHHDWHYWWQMGCGICHCLRLSWGGWPTYS
jgi:hypothetical protein